MSAPATYTLQPAEHRQVVEFAIAAMQGILANPALTNQDDLDIEATARLAFRVAVEMEEEMETWGRTDHLYGTSVEVELKEE